MKSKIYNTIGITKTWR